VIWYGINPAELNQSIADAVPKHEHELLVEGLMPGTIYHYLLETPGRDGPLSTYQFKTLPEKGADTKRKIAVLGDCGNDSENQKKVRDALVSFAGMNPPDAWILLGDNAYPDGKEEEYQKYFFDIYKDNLLNYPLFPAPGNHEYRDAFNARLSGNISYFKMFTVPEKGEGGGVPSGSKAYYSFDVGNAHFVSLDSYGWPSSAPLYDSTSAQVKWLKKDLEDAGVSGKKWVIVYFHHPPYSMGSHNSDEQWELSRLRRNLLPILERYGTDIVLSGHSHVYERSYLVQGHYGKEKSFNPNKHVLSKSVTELDKRATGNKGTVYIVSGSSGAFGGQQKSYPHEVMFYSNNRIGGAGMIEIENNTLRWNWIGADGMVHDSFVITKK
jgi:hypothetical protein